jgi:hypothetical protein
MPPFTYRDEDEIEEIVRKFEACELALTEFPHVRHLTVAAWYLANLERDEACARMRSGLLKFIGHHQKQGYHETITRFWMELVGSFLRNTPPSTTLVASVNALLERYSNKEILFRYYSRERVMSEAAKKVWLEPDLRALPGDKNENQEPSTTRDTKEHEGSQMT